MAVLLALLVATPFASAGTRSDPEIRGEAGSVDDPQHDLLGAWFEHHPDGVKLTIEVASIPSNQRDLVYWVSFRSGGVGNFAIVGFDGRGEIHDYLGSGSGSRWSRGGFDRVSNDLLEHTSIVRGAPGFVTAVIPWGAHPGLEEGSRLVDLHMGAARYDRARGVWQGGIDHTRSDAIFDAHPPVVALQQTLGIVVLAVAAAGVGGVGVAIAFGWRPWSKAPPSTAPTAAALRVPLSPPPPQPPDTKPSEPPVAGGRFRLDPRR